MSQVNKTVKGNISKNKNKIRPQISEEQYGFVKGKETRNAIFTLRILAKKALEVNQGLYLFFVDYEKAFDKVKYKDLMMMLERLEIDGKDREYLRTFSGTQK